MLYKTAIGEVLREERLAQNLRMRDVSSKGYIALAYLSEVENGRKEMSSQIFDGVAKALGVEAYELVFRAAMKMAGVEIPDSPAEILDGYLENLVK